MCILVFVCISVSVCACSIGVSICSSIGLRVFWDWVVWISGGKFTAQRLLSSVPACTALLQLSSPVHWEKKLNIAVEHFTCMCILLYVHYMPIICINCIYILTFTSFTYSAASCSTRSRRVNSLCVNILGKKKKSSFWVLTSFHAWWRTFFTAHIYVYLHMQWKYWITFFYTLRFYECTKQVNNKKIIKYFWNLTFLARPLPDKQE